MLSTVYSASESIEMKKKAIYLATYIQFSTLTKKKNRHRKVEFIQGFHTSQHDTFLTVPIESRLDFLVKTFDCI